MVQRKRLLQQRYLLAWAVTNTNPHSGTYSAMSIGNFDCGRISPLRLVRKLPMSLSGSTRVLRLPHLTSSIPITRMKNPSSSPRKHVDPGDGDGACGLRENALGLFHLGSVSEYHDLCR